MIMMNSNIIYASFSLSLPVITVLYKTFTLQCFAMYNQALSVNRNVDQTLAQIAAAESVRR